MTKTKVSGPSLTNKDLIRRRKKLGMTQLELAAALNVTPNSISNWERGANGIPILLHEALSFIEIKNGVPVG